MDKGNAAMKIKTVKTRLHLASDRIDLLISGERDDSASFQLDTKTATKLAIALLQRPTFVEGEISPAAVFDADGWNWEYDESGDLTIFADIDIASENPSQIGLAVSASDLEGFAEFLNKMIQDRPHRTRQ